MAFFFMSAVSALLFAYDIALVRRARALYLAAQNVSLFLNKIVSQKPITEIPTYPAFPERR